MPVVSFEGSSEAVTKMGPSEPATGRGLVIGSQFGLDGQQYLVIHSKLNSDGQDEYKVVRIP